MHYFLKIVKKNKSQTFQEYSEIIILEISGVKKVYQLKKQLCITYWHFIKQILTLVLINTSHH